MKQVGTIRVARPASPVLAGIGSALFAAAASATAAPIIVVGSHDLAANTAHQPIAIRVTGAQGIGSLSLNAQIGDGNGTDRPVFDGVDLVGSGTLFAANHLSPDDIGSTPRLATWTLVTANSTVSAEDALLTTLYIDTTGVSSGTFDLSLGNTLNGSTAFFDETGTGEIANTAITNGSFTVVPEPTSLGLAGVGAMLLLRRKR